MVLPLYVDESGALFSRQRRERIDYGKGSPIRLVLEYSLAH